MPSSLYITESALRKEVANLGGGRRAINLISEQICEWIEAGEVDPMEISLAGLAACLVENGDDYFRMMNPAVPMSRSLAESIGATNTSAFSNVINQLAYTTVLKAFNEEANIASSLVETVSTVFSGERIPGTAGVIDKLDKEIKELEPYPVFQFGEDFIDTPQTEKRGLIIAVTRELIFFNRIGRVVEMAKAVARILGNRKDKRIWDVILGFVNPFNWKGTNYNTYLTSGDNGPWINKKSIPFVDWESLDAMMALFDGLTDPYTGEPIESDPDTIIAPPALRTSIRMTLTATQVRKATNTAANLTVAETLPVSVDYNVQVSRKMRAALKRNGKSDADANATWLMGRPKAAFKYMENWPITVDEAPSDSHAAFTQDVVLQYKASERGAVAVQNPREMTLSTP